MNILNAVSTALADRNPVAAPAIADPTTGSAGSSTTGGTAASGSISGLTNESTFLQLLVAQIQNQDPLNPTDSTQFIAQLTQFSQLEQLLGINQGVQTLVTDTGGTGTPSTPTPANSISQ